MNPNLKRVLEVAIDVLFASLAYYAFGWVGFAVAGLFIISYLLLQIVQATTNTANILASRLPDRCAVCHREIVDEGGILSEDSICHERCVGRAAALSKTP